MTAWICWVLTPPSPHTAPSLPPPLIFSVFESVGTVNDYGTVGANDWRVVGGSGGRGPSGPNGRSAVTLNVAARQRPVPEVTAPAPMGRRLPVLTRKGRNRKWKSTSRDRRAYATPHQSARTATGCGDDCTMVSMSGPRAVHLIDLRSDALWYFCSVLLVYSSYLTS